LAYDSRREPVGLGFECWILHDGEPGSERIPYAPRALLQDVRQLVPEQALAVRRLRMILAGSEVNPRADRKGEGANPCGFGTDESPDVREARAKGRLHLPEHSVGQSPAGRVGQTLQ